MAVLIGIVILVALFLTGLIPKLNNNHRINVNADAAANEAPEVEVLHAKLASEGNLLLPATTQTLADTAVQSRTTGYISKVYVDIGAKVHKGELLATVESPDVDQQYNQASADTERSQATVGQARADLERSKATADESLSDLARQAAAIQQAQAAYDSAQAKVENSAAAQATAEARLIQSKHNLDSQKANLTQAQAQTELAKVTAQRYGALLKEGFVAQQDYDQAATTYKTTESGVAAMQANVAGAEADVAANGKSVQASADLVKSAKSDAAAAKSNIKANQEYYRSLQSAQKAATAGVQESQATIQANQAAAKSSSANQEHFGVLRSFEQIVAPFDGVITARNVNEGSLVSPGSISTSADQNTTPNVGLFGIAREDMLVIYVSLPEIYYHSVNSGTPINIHLREFPGKTFVGQMQRASGAIDQSTRTLLTEISLPNADGALVPGMYVQVEVLSGAVRKTLRIPSEVLVIDSMERGWQSSMIPIICIGKPLK